ncbi:unnamed protein product [Adineta ricciae]|uniref:peptidyl-tRNA hydrolase n=1 Tax=Adineta ricciae TaxID=249248 RepID=A0A814NNE3_ADIRI|nr:unnamed protein product [Adineta ricciae]CAF1096160.1 unnamed protein product [Adineta ricciae]
MAEGGPHVTAASSSSYTDVNEQFLATLVEMGIPQETARQALKRVNNQSLDAALAVVFGESIPTSNNQTNVEQSTQVSQFDTLAIDERDVEPIPHKMLFVVNGSLQMSSGKMAAQVAHCAVSLYQKLLERRPKALEYWQEYGETKIVVRGQSTEELLDIETKAKTNRSIVTATIEDAGLTEIASGSLTCLGLFGTNEQLKPITGHLKLMQDCLKCSGQ